MPGSEKTALKCAMVNINIIVLNANAFTAPHRLQKTHCTVYVANKTCVFIIKF